MSAFNNDPESSDNDEQTIDEDTCDQVELNRLFTSKLKLTTEEAISMKNVYILHIANSIDFDKIAVATSDKQVHLFKIQENNLKRATIKSDFLYTADDVICGLQFTKNDSNTFLVGVKSGSVFQIDLRTQEIVAIYKDDTGNKAKPIACFDLNRNDRVICAGTDRIGPDSFLLFFDVRKSSLMGGYWESHDDDITQVQFHPNSTDCLVTGSTDGLINIFDISNTDEYDALQVSLNTKSSVQTLNWHKNVYDSDVLSCITHTNDLHLYDVKESELIVEHSRESVTECMKRKSPDECNLINCHNTNDGNVFLLANSNYNRGECLRSLIIQNRKLIPMTNFIDNKQIVRASVYNEKENLLITGGERGILSLWSEFDGTIIKEHSSSLKDKSKYQKKTHKSKPY